jgi:hypothetical protein
MVELQPVDAVEVTLVVDNYVDVLLAGADGVRRFPLAYDHFDQDQLVAEHGFSALVTVESSGRRSSVLYDGGLTPDGLAARTGRRRLPLLIHPEAWRERKVTFPTGAELHLPPPSRADLEAEDLEVVVSACSHAGAVNVLRSPATAPAGRRPTAWPPPSPRRSSSPRWGRSCGSETAQANTK